MSLSRIPAEDQEAAPAIAMLRCRLQEQKGDLHQQTRGPWRSPRLAFCAFFERAVKPALSSGAPKLHLTTLQEHAQKLAPPRTSKTVNV